MKKFRQLILVALLPLTGCSSTALLLAGGAGVLFYAKDGIVWRTDSEQLNKETFRITVRKNTFPYNNGEGEAAIIFKRRAEDITYEHECNSYTTLSYTESLDSTSLVNQRIYEGVIRCNKPPQQSAQTLP
ncbi:hypothetical protein [Sulfurirhabdus autotrophica]|uniref:Uncharacterized protein n=1 Tax=Sulfurirhabdus autotrophica TaxID=1706046 RepID=A0A4R3YAN6_9PROT|nr:hypothetical protein [Sulfurirhabdus autotrophica]TCV87443.1 hypothetical protein EDC63_105112 [Sulfurirhabdus autotrophica]